MRSFSSTRPAPRRRAEHILRRGARRAAPGAGARDPWRHEHRPDGAHARRARPAAARRAAGSRPRPRRHQLDARRQSGRRSTATGGPGRVWSRRSPVRRWPARGPLRPGRLPAGPPPQTHGEAREGSRCTEGRRVARPPLKRGGDDRRRCESDVGHGRQFGPNSCDGDAAPAATGSGWSRQTQPARGRDRAPPQASTRPNMRASACRHAPDAAIGHSSVRETRNGDERVIEPDDRRSFSRSSGHSYRLPDHVSTASGRGAPSLAVRRRARPAARRSR
jgi:hypothetical protein